jgi:hypothetical protein
MRKENRSGRGWAWLAIPPLMASIVMFAVCERADAAEPQTKIDCDLTGPKGKHYEYSFVFDPAKGTLSWVQGGEELKMERHTPTELLVSRRGKFGDSPAQVAYFDLALTGGGATMTYFRDPTPAEIAKCEADRSVADCKAPVVLPQYDEAGTCSFEEQTAK